MANAQLVLAAEVAKVERRPNLAIYCQGQNKAAVRRPPPERETACQRS